MSSFRSAYRRAFTLVELLVVVAIIVILIAILLPSLDQAISVAETAKCGANQHAAGLGMTLYLLDHKGKYPQLWTYSGLMGNLGTINTLDVRARPLNAYLSYTTDGSLVPMAKCPSDLGDSLENTAGPGNIYEKYGTSYLNAWYHDPIFRIKPVFGSTNNTSHTITPSPTQRSFARTDNKIVLADWPLYGNRTYDRADNRWHTRDPMDRRFNTLFVDSHVELFRYDRDAIEDGSAGHGNSLNTVDVPANMGFDWW